VCALEVCPHTPTDPLTCRCAAIPRNNSLHLTSFRAPTFPISKLTTSVFPGFHRTGTLKTHRFSAATPAAHLKRLYRTCSGFHSLSRSATSAGACPDRDLAFFGHVRAGWIALPFATTTDLSALTTPVYDKATFKARSRVRHKRSGKKCALLFSKRGRIKGNLVHVNT